LALRSPSRRRAGILVADLDKLVLSLSSQDIEVDWDDELPDFRRIYVNDPFGNRLEFLQERSESHQPKSSA
jgi:hypothetical protein